VLLLYAIRVISRIGQEQSDRVRSSGQCFDIIPAFLKTAISASVTIVQRPVIVCPEFEFIGSRSGDRSYPPFISCIIGHCNIIVPIACSKTTDETPCYFLSRPRQ